MSLVFYARLSGAKREFMSSRSGNLYWNEIQFYPSFIHLIKCGLSPYKYKALDEFSHVSCHTMPMNTALRP